MYEYNLKMVEKEIKKFKKTHKPFTIESPSAKISNKKINKK